MADEALSEAEQLTDLNLNPSEAPASEVPTTKFKPSTIDDIELANRLTRGTATVRELITAASRNSTTYINHASNLIEAAGFDLDMPYAEFATKENVKTMMENPLLKAHFFNSGGFMSVEDNAEKFYGDIKNANRNIFKGRSYAFTFDETLRITGQKDKKTMGLARKFKVSDFDPDSTALHSGTDPNTKKWVTKTVGFQGRFSDAVDMIPEPENIIPRIQEGLSNLKYWTYDNKGLPKTPNINKAEDIRAILVVNAASIQRIGETAGLTNNDIRPGKIYSVLEWIRGQKERAAQDLGDLSSAVLRAAHSRSNERFLKEIGMEGADLNQVLQDPALKEKYGKFKIFSAKVTDVTHAFNPKYKTVNKKRTNILFHPDEANKLGYILNTEFGEDFGKHIKGPSAWRKIFPSLAIAASGLDPDRAGALISQVMGHSNEAGGAGLRCILTAAKMGIGHYLSPVKGYTESATRPVLQKIENMMAWFTGSSNLDNLAGKFNVLIEGLPEGIVTVDPKKQLLDTGKSTIGDVTRDLTKGELSEISAQSEFNAAKLRSDTLDINAANDAKEFSNAQQIINQGDTIEKAAIQQAKNSQIRLEARNKVKEDARAKVAAAKAAKFAEERAVPEDLNTKLATLESEFGDILTDDDRATYKTIVTSGDRNDLLQFKHGLSARQKAFNLNNTANAVARNRAFRNIGWQQMGIPEKEWENLSSREQASLRARFSVDPDSFAGELKRKGLGALIVSALSFIPSPGTIGLKAAQIATGPLKKFLGKELVQETAGEVAFQSFFEPSGGRPVPEDLSQKELLENMERLREDPTATPSGNITGGEMGGEPISDPTTGERISPYLRGLEGQATERYMEDVQDTSAFVDREAVMRSIYGDQPSAGTGASVVEPPLTAKHIQRARQKGFVSTPEEFERAKTSLMKEYEEYYKNIGAFD